jgi:hypothetical protein
MVPAVAVVMVVMVIVVRIIIRETVIYTASTNRSIGLVRSKTM